MYSHIDRRTCRQARHEQLRLREQLEAERRPLIGHDMYVCCSNYVCMYIRIYIYVYIYIYIICTKVYIYIYIIVIDITIPIYIYMLSLSLSM